MRGGRAKGAASGREGAAEGDFLGWVALMGSPKNSCVLLLAPRTRRPTAARARVRCFECLPTKRTRAWRPRALSVALPTKRKRAWRTRALSVALPTKRTRAWRTRALSVALPTKRKRAWRTRALSVALPAQRTRVAPESSPP